MHHWHWGQILTHMRTICIKCIWSVVKTNITKLPLTDKGQLCCIICALVWGNKACDKGGLWLSKATLCVIYQVQTICVWGIWRSYASVIAPVWPVVRVLNAADGKEFGCVYPGQSEQSRRRTWPRSSHHVHLENNADPPKVFRSRAPKVAVLHVEVRPFEFNPTQKPKFFGYGRSNKTDIIDTR